MPTRLLIELIAALGVAIAVWVAWEHHNSVEQKLGEDKIIAVDKAATEKQAKVDAVLIKNAEDKHAKELADIKAAYDNQSIQPIVVCYRKSPSILPAPTVRFDQSGPSANSGPSAVVYPDIGPALRVLAKRLDTLNADARQLNGEVSK